MCHNNDRNSLLDIQFLKDISDEEKGKEEFEQITKNLFGKDNLKQKSDLSKKEIMGLLYLEMQNQNLRKELNLKESERSILDVFISLYSEYKVSEKRKGRNELVNSYIAKMIRIKEEETTTKELI